MSWVGESYPKGRKTDGDFDSLIRFFKSSNKVGEIHLSEEKKKIENRNWTRYQSIEREFESFELESFEFESFELESFELEIIDCILYY